MQYALYKILISSENKAMAHLINSILSGENVHAEMCEDVEDLDLSKKNPYHLFITDDIFDCEYLTSTVNSPVLYLVPYKDEDLKVKGIKFGCTCLDAPFSPFELAAMVESCLGMCGNHKKRVESTHFTLDKIHHEILYEGNKVTLTPKEYELFSLLIENKNTPLSKDFLLRKIWGLDTSMKTNVLPVFIERLREELQKHGCDPQVIKLVRGFGYEFND
jgi:DNA-binding response OmpR family regulator